MAKTIDQMYNAVWDCMDPLPAAFTATANVRFPSENPARIPVNPTSNQMFFLTNHDTRKVTNIASTTTMIYSTV